MQVIIKTLNLVLLSVLLLPPKEGSVRLVAPPRPIPANFFGMHMHHADDTTPWPAVRFGVWRLWDAFVAWPDLEPRRDEWQFDRLDRYVELAEQHHARVLLVLGLTPAWASARPKEKSAYKPGFAAEPKNLEDWRVYVRTVAQRYKGRIEAYEVWNEPNLRQTWTGTIEQMVSLTRAAAEVIHGIDPEAKVVSPSPTSDGGLAWLAQFLSKGGGKDVDVVGYHFYVTPKPPEAIVPLVGRVKMLINNNGLSDLPLWNTETGWSGPKPFPSQELGAAYLARAYILNWAAGIERFCWYAWDNHEWVALQTTEQDSHTLTQAGKSYDAVFRWLTGARMKECSENREHTWSCELERDGHPQWLVWNSAGQSFRVPGEWHATESQPLLGDVQPVRESPLQVGPMPILIRSAIPAK